MRLLVSVSSAAIAAALLLAPAASADLRADLADARERWEQRSATSYSFRLKARCMVCSSVASEVRVKRGKAQMTPPAQPFVDQLDTVTEQFAFIESWIDRAEQLVVRYSPRTGVPTLVILDPVRLTIDDEVSFRVSKLKLGKRA